VKATPAQLAFIIPVIIVAPVVAGILVPKFEGAGTILLTVSMFGSLVFGVYYHFIADTIDHVAHVAYLQPAFWSQMFQLTAFVLALSEMFGTGIGLILLVRQRNTEHSETHFGAVARFAGWNIFCWGFPGAYAPGFILPPASRAARPRLRRSISGTLSFQTASPALPPRVRYRLEAHEPILNLTPSTPALPPA
jgi:hypothetical protein